MSVLLLIPDGAHGALSAASAPVCHAMPNTATVTTVPVGLPVTSEVAIPSLLGVSVTTVPARGAVEAVSAGLEVGPGASAWRLDLEDAARMPPEPHDVEAALAHALDGATVRHLRAGRFVVVGPAGWLGDGRHGHRTHLAAEAIGQPVHLWGGGTAARLPAVARRTVVVAAPTGAASGTARLVGADLVVPDGATGFPGTDLPAKAAAAETLLVAGEHEVVAVHVGAADEAGHAGDADLQRRSIEAFDREVVDPLLDVARQRRVPVAVAPDHGTDPVTRRHVAGPVTVHATVALPSHVAARDLLARLTAAARSEVAA